MKEISRAFLFTGLLCLLCALVGGCITGLQFLFPDFLAAQLPFYKMRPLHVSFAVWWLFLVATGGVYFYLTVLAENSEFGIDRVWLESKTSKLMTQGHFLFFLVAGVLIAGCYVFGIFGGKKYLEYPPQLSLLVLAGWILFAGNVWRACGMIRRDWPVFMWMWFTSSCIFIYVFVEAHLWLLPYFGGNVVRDVAVQWKSYGALVASWNMLIYGTAMCIMYMISRDRSIVYGRLPFALYFIGLLNSLFNWGHHTYTLPTQNWLREVAYFVSMTELIILFRIIQKWSSGLAAGQKFRHLHSYRFMSFAEGWVVLNLILALAISIPALNVFVHGTHVVVAHSMGTTLGINTMILLSSVCLILQQSTPLALGLGDRRFNIQLLGTNVALLVFWLALIAAGIHKGYLIFNEPALPYREVIAAIRPYIIVFVSAGFCVFAGLTLLVAPLISRMWSLFSRQSVLLSAAPVA